MLVVLRPTTIHGHRRSDEIESAWVASRRDSELRTANAPWWRRRGRRSNDTSTAFRGSSSLVQTLTTRHAARRNTHSMSVRFTQVGHVASPPPHSFNGRRVTAARSLQHLLRSALFHALGGLGPPYIQRMFVRVACLRDGHWAMPPPFFVLRRFKKPFCSRFALGFKQREIWSVNL